MRTTLRKRSFSSSNSSQTSFKRRKLNLQHENNSPELSFDQAKLQAMYQQLISLKNKHGLNQTNDTNTTSNHKQNKKTNDAHHNTHNVNNKSISKPTAKHHKKQNSSTTIHHQDINNFLEIDEHQNHDINNTQNDTECTNKETDDEWNTFINSVNFKPKQKPLKTPDKSVKIRDKSSYLSTEKVWNAFLDSNYDDNNERNKDWKPPEINKFWDQGPIGLVSDWWNDHHLRASVDQKQDEMDPIHDTNIKKELTTSEISKKKQNKWIKLDVMKELKQQRLEKRLMDRMKHGEIVKNMDDANNLFESFFVSALEMGDRLRSGDIIETLKTDEEHKTEKKTKIFQPKLKKIKTIATFDNDDLFYFEPSDDDGDDVIHKINENDMIYLDENSIGNSDKAHPAIIAARMQSEQVLLKQRVKMQHQDMLCDEEVECGVNKMSDGVVSAKILSDTVEDSLKEKRILKRLNVMDFVSNYKNAFFREVEELKLNPSVLLDNWQIIKKHDGLSRKLRKKLGIMMARERARRDKENKVINDMINDSESDDTENDCDVLSETNVDIGLFLDE